MTMPAITRRGFAFGISAAAGGIVLGIPAESLGQQPSAQQPATPGQPAPLKPLELTAWVVIEADDSVRIRIARSEMGQGIFTTLPMLVAEELECDWAKVKPEFADTAEHIARKRLWGDMRSTNSRSVRTSQEILRKAGAQARTMLVSEAAARWAVPVDECNAGNSIVTHRPSRRTFRYGELAEAAARRRVPAEVELKAPKEWRLIGTAVKPLDTRAKVTGEPVFASDIRLPDMLYAAVASCPSFAGRHTLFEYAGKLVSFDDQKVLVMPGVRKVVRVGDTAVAVIASTWWQAKKALEALPVVWDANAGAGVTTDALRETFEKGLGASDAAVGEKHGDVVAALASAAKVITAEHRVPYLCHATMEPQTCTAHVTADRVDVWAPTQNGEGTANVVAEALGVPVSKVYVHKCRAGGGFGRRGLSQDWARMSVLIAAQVDVPVKMQWSREEDIRHDFYRPMFVARQTAGFDKDGTLIAWKIDLCASSIQATLQASRQRNGVDMSTMHAYLEEDLEGGKAYHVANYQVAFTARQTQIPVGYWRGVNFTPNGFFRETFVDEMAKSAGKNPYQFRREMFAKAPRSLRVLDEVAKRSNWGRQPAGVYQGMALVEHEAAVCAQVVEISVDKEGALKVHRVVCVIDPVFVLHPGMAVMQMEGGIIQALGAALHGEITFENGQVQQSNFHDYALLRMNEVPRIETHLLPCGGDPAQAWGSVGEVGVPPLAPALVNAVFAATGQRIRSLPLRNHKLKAA